VSCSRILPASQCIDEMIAEYTNYPTNTLCILLVSRDEICTSVPVRLPRGCVRSAVLVGGQSRISFECCGIPARILSVAGPALPYLVPCASKLSVENVLIVSSNKRRDRFVLYITKCTILTLTTDKTWTCISDFPINLRIGRFRHFQCMRLYFRSVLIIV
jgi:hypothetical protein